VTNRTFANPIFVRTGEHLVQEIASLDDAFDFLDEWPRELQGTAYDVAYNTCSRAYCGEVAIDVAHQAIVGFAKSAMILEEFEELSPFQSIAINGFGRGGASA